MFPSWLVGFYFSLVEVAITVAILKKAIESQLAAVPAPPGILIDGFPREVAQAEEFESQFGRSCDVLLFLEASEEAVTQRLLSRGETSGRSDDNLEAIKKRLEVYREKTAPVIAAFAVRGLAKTLNADGDKDSVWVQALPALDELACTPIQVSTSAA